MHFQFIIKQDDLNELETTSLGHGSFRTKVKGYDEHISYTVDDSFIRFHLEVSEDYRMEYHTNRKYELRVLPFMMGAVAYIHHKRALKVGLSTHTVMVHNTDKPGRFLPQVEFNKIVLHELEGLIFVREEDYYLSVPDELACSMLVENMSLSLRFFDEKYMVRFETSPRQYVYAPLNALYQSEPMRRLMVRSVKDVNLLDWKSKQQDIENFVETFTKPK